MNSTYQEMEQTDIKARLYIDVPLAAGAVIALPSDQMHYLLHVLRLNLGAAIGVSYQQIQKNERGINRVAASRLYRISLALDAPLDWFFEGFPSLQAHLEE